MNPLSALKLKGVLDAFKTNHPKVPMFLRAAISSMDVGSVVEISLTTSEGKKLVTNFRVTEDDMAHFAEIKDLT